MRDELDERGSTAEAVIIRVSDIVPEVVRWLWPGYIPFGKITVLDGNPSQGKSTAALDLAARLSVGGRLPDGATCEPGNSIIMSGEDGPADTIRPRLEVAGSDLDRIFVLSAIRDKWGEQTAPALDTSVTEIEAAIVAHDAKLLIIDPLMMYLGATVDSYRDQGVRQVLGPVAAVAERTGAAVFVIRHLRKASAMKNAGGALFAGGGSIGIIGAARSGLLIGRDPHDKERFIMASTKSNLCKTPPSLGYRIESGPAPFFAAFLTWESGSVGLTADQLVAAQGDGSGEEAMSALELAEDFLRNILADGPRPQKEVVKEAKAEGIPEINLRRARSSLGVKARRVGMGPGGHWELSLPIGAHRSSYETGAPMSAYAVPEGAATRCSYHRGNPSGPCSDCGRGISDHMDPS